MKADVGNSAMSLGDLCSVIANSAEEASRILDKENKLVTLFSRDDFHQPERANEIYELCTQGTSVAIVFTCSHRDLEDLNKRPWLLDRILRLNNDERTFIYHLTTLSLVARADGLGYWRLNSRSGQVGCDQTILLEEQLN